MHRKGQPKATYPLEDVRRLVNSGKWKARKNALEGAWKAFGWESDDIRRAILALKPCHFYKSDWSNARCSDGIMLDFYKSRFRGEDVYTHFYVENGVLLVVNSFKEAE
ncbi:MAG TPA: type II toxin-antitoxin system MqsR family toxin [Candidatus Latescibacteria bacterium]|jgi:hypothetical protein|nr:type II toxin-antitoxin system MqsR family toxin [Candidatus Latescibacterota bacterium]